MSAQFIYDHAPLGSLIRYGNGETAPPARFTRKRAAWDRRNGVGRLVGKQPSRERAVERSPGSITLHEGDFGYGGIILVTVRQIYLLDSDLHFEIAGRPSPGMVRVLDGSDHAPELLHLAPCRDDADRWLASHRYPHARLEAVTANDAPA